MWFTARSAGWQLSGSFLSEAEEARGKQEADDAVAHQPQNIGHYRVEILAKDHHAIESLHCPGGQPDFGNLLHPIRFNEERPPRASNG